MDAQLKPHGIIGISPLRCEPLIGEKYEFSYQDPKFGSTGAIKAKNCYDIKHCDLTLAYLPKPKDGAKQSYGTIWEIGAAFMYGKHVIVVSDDEHVQRHPLLGGAADWKLDTLEEAADVLIGILGGYNGGKNV